MRQVAPSWGGLGSPLGVPPKTNAPQIAEGVREMDIARKGDLCVVSRPRHQNTPHWGVFCFGRRLGVPHFLSSGRPAADHSPNPCCSSGCLELLALEIMYFKLINMK